MKAFRKMVCMLVLALLVVQVAGFPAFQARAEAAADPAVSRFPEAGGKTGKNGSLTIDYTHMDRGYVIVRAKKSDRKMRLIVEHGSDSLYYEINGQGKEEVIPLQFGSGKYTFTLVMARQKGSSRYSASGSVTLRCSMADETGCFLYPNQYVDYGADSPLVETAQDLCKGLNTPEEITGTICDYVSTHFAYDWAKAGKIQSDDIRGMTPDIAGTWQSRTGVCQDLSAVTCAMLRSQGVPAKLAIGRANGRPHAWVVIIIGGKGRLFDPSPSAAGCPSPSAKSYRAERYY